MQYMAKYNTYEKLIVADRSEASNLGRTTERGVVLYGSSLYITSAGLSLCWILL